MNMKNVGFSAVRAHFLEAKPEHLPRNSVLPHTAASLSLLSFHTNNVQMSRVEINKTQEFLISLE